MNSFPELAGLRIDEVMIYGDQLTFRLPHDWEDFDESDEYYCYEEPGQDGGSGWLRVSLITHSGEHSTATGL